MHTLLLQALCNFVYPYSVFAYGHLAVIPIGLIFSAICVIPLCVVSLNLLCAQFIMQQFIKAFYPFWEVFLMVIWWSVAR